MLSPEPAIPKNQTGGSTQVCYNRVSSKLLLTPSGHTGSIRLPHVISVALTREDLESGMHYLPPAVGSRLLRSEFRFVVQLVQPADQTAAIRRGYGDHSPSPTVPRSAPRPRRRARFQAFSPRGRGKLRLGAETPVLGHPRASTGHPEWVGLRATGHLGRGIGAWPCPALSSWPTGQNARPRKNAEGRGLPDPWTSARGPRAACGGDGRCR